MALTPSWVYLTTSPSLVLYTEASGIQEISGVPLWVSPRRLLGTLSLYLPILYYSFFSGSLLSVSLVLSVLYLPLSGSQFYFRLWLCISDRLPGYVSGGLAA